MTFAPANDNNRRGWSKRSWLYFGFLLGLWAGWTIAHF